MKTAHPDHLIDMRIWDNEHAKAPRQKAGRNVGASISDDSTFGVSEARVPAQGMLGLEEQRATQLGIGREALTHVLEIIGAQQQAAHERPALEPCDVSDIVAKNATIARYSGNTSIAFSFPSHSHWGMANRVILSQVVGNLFSNAAEAIAATGRESGSIAVSVTERDGKLQLIIRDDGEGFDPAKAPTLFQRGFSTRAHKSGGLGLHWCANSMLAMEGSLELQSDGKGTGARAVLTMGLAEVERAEAA